MRRRLWFLSETPPRRREVGERPSLLYRWKSPRCRRSEQERRGKQPAEERFPIRDAHPLDRGHLALLGEEADATACQARVLPLSHKLVVHQGTESVAVYTDPDTVRLLRLQLDRTRQKRAVLLRPVHHHVADNAS